MKKLIKFARGIGILNFISTIIFNLKFFPLSIAIKLPVHVTRKVKYNLSTFRDSIIFDKESLYFGSLKIGFLDNQYTWDRPSFLKINGKLIIHGSGFHEIASGVTLEIGKDAIFEMGNNFSASHNNRIRILSFLKVGDDNMWSYDNVILDNDGHEIYNYNGEIENNNKGIIFGNNVWLGCRNLVLKGASIPNTTIIAPGGG